METSISTDLCKGLRACGIPKRQALQILNIVTKWYDNSGCEWTNSRIKDLRQWFESCLTGEPKPPGWFKHSKDGYPLGIWSWVFKLPIAKALAVLSLNTVFYEKTLSPTQKEKFLHGLAGNGSKGRLPDKVFKMYKDYTDKLPSEMPPIRFPTVFDMTGSIPVHDGQSTVRPKENLGQALKALRLSWESVPQVTFDFLDHQDLLGYMPLDVLGNKYQLELNRKHSRIVGRVSVLQQPQLKARIVGNPNRVLQVTLEPLKELYMNFVRNLPTDVTHDQESGVRWVQDQLRRGIRLSESDLTSASDLLEIKSSLDLVDQTFDFPRVKGYLDYRKYYESVCRERWLCPQLNREVVWEQGDVLGTGPSFGKLTLTNNAAGFQAYSQFTSDCRKHGKRPDFVMSQAFRVVGDDIVMRSELLPYYTKIIEDLGGEINHSKTLESNRVAEFAGRIITPDSSYLKAIKYSEPSDNSFMSFMSQLGDQAKYFLMPKQRRVYDLFKEVPGIAVDGPWMKDSYGVPLGPRYQWYLEEVQPALDAAEPDHMLLDYDSVMLKAKLSLAEAGNIDDGKDFIDPFMDDDGYLPSQVTPTFKVGGDPRLTDGKTQLDVLHKHVAEKDITPFEDWNQKNRSGLASDEAVQTSPISTPPEDVTSEVKTSGKKKVKT